jgi:hypothetical protein
VDYPPSDPAAISTLTGGTGTGTGSSGDADTAPAA